jgi:hypothetical protein
MLLKRVEIELAQREVSLDPLPDGRGSVGDFRVAPGATTHRSHWLVAGKESAST